ncbi:TPA: AAA family ATPase [Vibrio cholerae]|uniref:McrB family protein n=1 Tax=Vibrio TaxID=662 RepID=UPI000DE4FDD7|nr:AAA family ATPase [Vibrio paracholerae]EGS7960442.1 AAA domain-containing protein [Vibrio cholerae]EHK7541324.1 AAA family ATPase [Vibrio cholerae]EII3002125.1 AAA family ATPase [Vibrio cholerae]EIY4766067.1 AAA family ATPase [Vibrio cholerae]EJL6339577.1 AAA family ATPase [Vibrio cholerae]
MINEAKYDMRGFVLNQISSKKIGIDESKVEQIIEQINAAVLDASQYTDWEVKSNIHAELKIRIRSILDKQALPIVDEVFEEVLSRAKRTTGSPKSFWFVGASYDKGSEDQTERFLNDGVWQNGYEDKYLDVVRSMQPGDKIAIKSSYTRKRELPFDTKGQTVSVMGIKAIGVITRNHGDGRFVDVEWQPRFAPVREWYFYTNRSTIWRVSPDDWMTEGLTDFTFNNKPQDIDRFRNAPYWKERFGDTPVDKQRFKWTQFYEEFADKLLAYKDDRAPLMAAIHNLPNKIDSISVLQDQPKEGTKELLSDICPFTVFGLFNRGITDANRIAIANELAAFLEVETPVPNSFEGIPVVNNQRSWFFGYKYRRGEHDIDTLWNLFEAAIEHANNSETDTAEVLYEAYEAATKCWGTGWNLSMGLYWIRPWKYLTLDGQSQTYITKKLGLKIGKNGEKGRCSSKDYFGLIDDLETRFQEDAYPVHSFPELSLSAWLFKDTDTSAHPKATDLDDEELSAEEDEVTVQKAPIEPYTIDDIIADGCFLERESIAKIIAQLRNKKNLILQGPPGTGKTWLAKKLGFAVMGQKDENSLRAVQFHPNLSYEDFVRGWRPSGEGKLTLVDGPFLEMINQAKQDASKKYVVVIEEINRGNPAQIFGEMLTLLEADKRTPSEALELSYRRVDGERIHIPANLFVIGTMNIADRSLALVDLALRRRFAFFDLKPTFGESWRNWVNSKSGINEDFLQSIEQRIVSLNNEISKDRNLGPQFKIGHSYVTPPLNTKIEDAAAWFQGVVETEIGPLLEEYWFDDIERAIKSKDALVEGI